MPGQGGIPSHYPCLLQKDGLRLVHHPHDERAVIRRDRARRRFAKLLAMLRA